MELVVQGLVNIIAWLAIAAGLILAGWWAIGLFSVRSREQEEEVPSVDGPAGIKEKLSGVPLVLLLYFVFTGITMLAYILTTWATGTSY